jgi:hypothetical protein
MRKLSICTCLAMALSCAVGAFAAERTITSQPAVYYGGTDAKASGDTIDLMGPGGLYPYRGDFETASARPGGAGLLPDGWYSVDETAPANHWHVDAYNNPFSGKAAWCGDIGIASCGSGDVDGGYLNNWRDILEFRKTVGAAASVRVQADLQYDTEPGYDYLTLQRRTAVSPDFEPVNGGQGQSWDGAGIVAVDYTFSYTPAELYEGSDIAVAFIFDSDGGWSDGDCSWPTNGAARLDNMIVTVNATVYTEDFEDDELGPDWSATPNVGVGDFARVWGLLGDVDDCAVNYSKLIAFIDDGLVVPGTGGTVGGPGNDYGPPGGYIVNNTGGLLGPSFHLQASVYSPVMTLPDPAPDGMTFAFDLYRHELLIANDSPGIFYTWAVRTCFPCEIYIPEIGPWQDRGFVYYGGPNYVRSINEVSDLIETGSTQVQVMMGVYELGWQFGYGNGTNGTPAPYFDNVSVKVYPVVGPRIVVTELRMANDGFPAIGDIDLVNLGANSVRFDMAANIAPRSHLRNDPGDSIWIDVTARAGGALVGPPVMHSTFAKQNPLFDAYRTLPTSPVAGNVTRTATGAVVANRFNFDLPDTGMLFPGDVLHYYFAATDDVAGDVRTSYAPVDRAGFGNAEPLAYPTAYTVNCLPTIIDASGTQPRLLFWNDEGIRGGEDEWYSALRYLKLDKGSYVDIFTTKASSSGVGNGLGGRATVSQIDGYSDMLYCSGDLSSPTLSNGDFNGDPGNDLGLLNDWFALGGRDLFMTGDDLAASLTTSGAVAQAFLETRMGLTFNDGDVRDNIAGQTAALVVQIAGNPVFTTAASWFAYGGCAAINDFDNVVPRGGAIRLAQFTAPGGTSTPYSYAAAVLNSDGTNRVVSMNHDLRYVMNWDKSAADDAAKSPAPIGARTVVLSNVLDYFGVANNPNNMSTGVALPAAPLAVACFPNPFNPSLMMRYTLARPGQVTMKVYDTRGALVRTLLDGHVDQLTGAVTWDGTDQAGGGVSSGLYFVETRADGQVDVRKVTMLK